MKLLQFIKHKIPNTITCLNLLSGCLAVIFAFRSGEQIGALTGYQWAFVCIGAAAVFDFCDGFSARLLHAYSALGKELDSLADEISFGLAPAMLMFNVMKLHNEPGSIFPYFALLIAAFGSVRLAKFNIDERQTTSFIGLPIPANAIFWIGFCAWLYEYGFVNNYILVALIIIVSYLMVSNIKMFSLKFKNLHFGENLLRYALILGALLFVITYGVSGLVWTIVLYIALSLFSKETNK